MTRRPVIALTVPEGLLAIAALAVALWPGTIETLADVLPYYRYAVLGIGLLLAWRFHRGRILLALIVVVLADRAFQHTDGRMTPTLVAMSASPLLAWQAAAKEHGVLARWTGFRFVGIVAVAVLGFVLVRRVTVWPAVLEHSLLPAAWTPLSTAAVVVALGAAAFLAARFMINPNPVDQGLFWSLVTVVAALHFPRGGSEAGLLFGTAALILAVATTEDAYGLAYRDELTGLGSRRALERAMKRLGRQYSIGMVDVDRFKRINDAHGHDVGDQVLRLVATRLRRTGGGGKIYRYGGEEFAILFPGRSAEEVLPHLEAARATVEAATFRVRSPDRPKRRPKKPRSRSGTKSLNVTVSIGLADTDGNHSAPEAVINRADRALYQAKKKGRNRVMRKSS